MYKNIGNGVLHEDIRQKMTTFESWCRASAILDAILNFEVCPPVLHWYSLVSENTPPKDSKTVKISHRSFHSRLDPNSSRLEPTNPQTNIHSHNTAENNITPLLRRG